MVLRACWARSEFQWQRSEDWSGCRWQCRRGSQKQGLRRAGLPYQWWQWQVVAEEDNPDWDEVDNDANCKRGEYSINTRSFTVSTLFNWSSIESYVFLKTLIQGGSERRFFAAFSKVAVIVGRRVWQQLLATSALSILIKKSGTPNLYKIMEKLTELISF